MISPQAPSARLFLAARLSPECNESVGALVRELRPATAARGIDVTWVGAGNLHVTLKFLGATPESRIAEIARAARAALAGFECFEVTAAGVGVFPNESRPKVLWVNLSEDSSDFGEGQFERMARALDESLAAIGFRREPYPFTPHLTIGRVKEGRQVAELLFPFKTRHFGSSVIREVILYESRTDPAGAVYTVRDRFALKS